MNWGINDAIKDSTSDGGPWKGVNWKAQASNKEGNEAYSPVLPKIGDELLSGVLANGDDPWTRMGHLQWWQLANIGELVR